MLLIFGVGSSAANLIDISVNNSLLGALGGYALLFLINTAYRAWRHTNGFGSGDLKLLAGLGAWLGWKALMPILLLSSITALFAAFCFSLGGKEFKAASMIPFGPELIVGGIIMYAKMVPIYFLGQANAHLSIKCTFFEYFIFTASLFCSNYYRNVSECDV